MTTAIMTATVHEQLAKHVNPILKAYLNDFAIHDRNWIDDNPGVPFIHMTRECGTNIAGLHTADSDRFPPAGEYVPYIFATANRLHILRDESSVIHCQPTEHAYLYCDGTTVKPITYEEATIIVSSHIRKIRLTWNE